TFTLVGDGGAGVFVRSSLQSDVNGGLYTFSIFTGGYIALEKYVNGSWTSLLGPTHNSDIKQTSDNSLTLQVQDKHLTAAINGHQVFVYTDANPLAAGYWGIFVESQGSPASGHFAHVTAYGAET